MSAASTVRSIVLASGNAGKIAELRELLAPYRVNLRALAEFTDITPEETGSTFEANALLKARFAAEMARMPAIADDSGLEVDALHGAPGVFSARYAGAGSTDAANNQKLLSALAGVPPERRTARFRCVLVFVRTAVDTQPVFAEGVWAGTLLDAPRGANGFGYDPLFLPRDSAHTSAELSRGEKNLRSHRALALRTLVASLVEAREIEL